MEIFGILNVTPDSFSDGGEYVDIDSVRIQVAQMIADGATIIDVGGESTRPGASYIDPQVEIKRVIPVIEMIKQNFDVTVSIDTYKSEVAKAAINAGASIINDVKANTYDGKMLDLVQEYGVMYVAMHSRESTHLLEDIKKLFDEIIEQFNSRGISGDKLILDPGIGFAKNIDDNLIILNNLKMIRDQYKGYKFLLGASRKRFIGTINNLEIASMRVIGTSVTTTLAVQADFDYVRVHDIIENKQAIEMIEAVMKA